MKMKNKMERIYLDYNATTPVDERVLENMLPYFLEKPGNASSRNHPFGWEADEAVIQCRESIAAILKVDPRELVFTSGATESLNLAIKGIFGLYQVKGKHIITVKTEHNAVLDTCGYLEKKGADVTYLDVDENGLLDVAELRSAIRPDTILVAVMWANNETGVIQPMDEIGAICSEKQVLFLSDATQAVGKMPIYPKETGVSLMAFTAHKIYGPKGVGALYISHKGPRVKLNPLIHGGGHENGFRSGTLNVPGIVGLAKALEIAYQNHETEYNRLKKLRDNLEESLLHQLDAVFINGKKNSRMPHVSNVSFQYIEAEALMNTFNQKIAASTGSACSSALLEPSHVLMAMGLNKSDAQASVRFSLGRFTTQDQIEIAVERIVKGVNQLRSESPVWDLYQDGVL